MRFARSRPTVVTCMADGSSLWRHTTTTTLGTRCRSAGAVHPINYTCGHVRHPNLKAIPAASWSHLRPNTVLPDFTEEEHTEVIQAIRAAIDGERYVLSPR